METTYRYPIKKIGEPFEISLPIGAEVLFSDHIQQHVFIWVKVNTGAVHPITHKKKEIRTFCVVATGDQINGWWTHIGSFIIREANEVWHTYEIKK